MKKKNQPLNENEMITDEHREAANNGETAESSMIIQDNESTAAVSDDKEVTEPDPIDNTETPTGPETLESSEAPEVTEAQAVSQKQDLSNAPENLEDGDQSDPAENVEPSDAAEKPATKHKFTCFPAELLAFQAFCECYFFFRLSQTDLLPAKYLTTAIVILAALFFLPALLLLIRRRSASHQRIVSGVVISLLIVALSAGGSFAAMKTGDTMRIVSVSNEDNTVYITSEIGFYVTQENPAEKLKEMQDCQFARVTVMDQENTDKAIRKIEDKFGKNIEIVEENSIEEALKDLYDDKVQVLILNTSCVTLLEESESGEYDDLEEKIRLLKKMQIKTQVELMTDNVDTSEAARAVTEQPFVMYLSGSDTRNMTLATSGSDVNILMFMDPINHQVLLINTPRDSYIGNPAGKGAKDKLTHCGYYGVNNSIEALKKLYDIDIDFYAQINFTGFKRLIDAIGGITAYSDSSFQAEGYTFEEGDVEMDGDMALVFARDRYHQLDGDNARGRHQMAVIKAMLEKMSTEKSLLMKYPEIMNTLQGMFVTDMSTESMTALIRLMLNDGAVWNIQSYALIGPNGMAKTYSMPGTELSVIYPTKHSLNHTKDLIRMFEEGETITEEIAMID